MLSEPLVLNLGMPTGNALAFFTESADMRAVFPVEEGLGVLAEGEMSRSSVGFCAFKQLNDVVFSFTAVSLSRGVECLLFCQSIIPQMA